MDREIYIAENGLEYCTICKEPLEQFLSGEILSGCGMEEAKALTRMMELAYGEE